MDSGRSIMRLFSFRRSQKGTAQVDHETRAFYEVSGLFDANWYIDVNKDLQNRDIDPLHHYLNHGWSELRDPSPHFSIWTYFTLYPEVRASGIEPLKHFILYGGPERRIPNPAFEPKWYAARYGLPSDVAPLQHFLQEGADNGFWPHPLFDPKWYAINARNASMSVKEAYTHFLESKLGANPNAFFDCKYYIREYSDVADAGLHPLLHYYLHGGFEGRNPSEFFDSQWYLATNQDVASGGFNPLVHFLHYGRTEGRLPRRNLADSVKEIHGQLSQMRLESFLQSGDRLPFPQARKSKYSVSLLLILYNKANLTFDCLDSLYKIAHASKEIGLEIIIFDNASSDDTYKVLEKIDGCVIIRNSENIGFLRAVNQAAEKARGEYLLLLNNDTQVQFGALEAACEVLDADQQVGAVGGMLVLPDAKVQEAGSIIWKDGSCLGYGRGLAYDDPSVSFRREVDFCSGAFLMTRTELFGKLGGFDQALAPAYYEETDYCTRLWQNGYKVVYEPSAKIIHFEFGSAASGTIRNSVYGLSG